MAKTIFVLVPSYRDPECMETLRSLFGAAKSPDRVYVGLCWVYEPGVEPPFVVWAERAAQIRRVSFTVEESAGAGWALAQCQSLYDGEDYALVVHAHSRFAKHWDERLLAQLDASGAGTKVLSGMPAPLWTPRLTASASDEAAPALIPQIYDGKRRLALTPHPLPSGVEHPVRGAFGSTSFFFGPAEALDQVRWDPAMQTDQLHVDFSARLFTSGWDIYHPNDSVVFHYSDYDAATSRPRFRENKDRYRALSRIARQRLKDKLRYRGVAAPGGELDTAGFTLGTTRTLDEFEAFCGVDLLRGEVDPRGRSEAFLAPPPGVKRTNKKTTTPQPTPRRPEATRIAALERHGRIQQNDLIGFLKIWSHENKYRLIEEFGGKPTFLCYLSDLRSPSHIAIAHRVLRIEDDPNRATTGIVMVAGTVDEVAAQRNDALIEGKIYVDKGGTFAKNAGIPANESYLLLLDANLRVARAPAPIEDTAATLDLLAADTEVAHTHAPYPICHHPPVIRVQHVLSPRQCQALVEYAQTLDLKPGSVYSSRHRKRRISEKKVRLDCYPPADVVASLDEIFARTLYPEIEKAFDLFITHREPFKIGFYTAEQGGKFGVHRDNYTPAMAHRRVALSLNLTDGFEGGGLTFPEYGPGYYQHGIGEAVIFPCSLMHQVYPVTSGTRVSLLGFLYDDDGQDYHDRYRISTGLQPRSRKRMATNQPHRVEYCRSFRTVRSA